MQLSRFFLLSIAIASAPLVDAQTKATPTANAPVADARVMGAPNAATTTRQPLMYKESYSSSGGRRHDRDERRNRDGRRGCDHDHNRPCNRCSTVIIGAGGYYPGTVPVYPGYSSYPTYGYPNNYPAYPYAPSVSGSSVTISSPGFSNGMFTAFPYSTTVTTFNSGYPNGTVIAPGCAPGYYPSYPAYPTYVPGGHLQGYRGAATPGYGAYGYSGGGLSVGYSNHHSSGYSTGLGHYSSRSSGISIGVGIGR